jgi:hypothetical protein
MIHVRDQSESQMIFKIGGEKNNKNIDWSQWLFIKGKGKFKGFVLKKIFIKNKESLIFYF